jgi:hypothetical protein
LSNDPDTATCETVQEMCSQINSAADNPSIAAAAVDAVSTYSGRPVVGADSTDRASAAFWWCKWNLHFKHHGDMFEVWADELGNPQTKLQLLISPDVLVRMQRMEGDCAIYTMMVCALLRALGLDYQIAVYAVNPMQPEIFSHVNAQAVIGRAVLPLDASHGPIPGWNLPERDASRVWVFDSSGRILSKQEGRFTGLHAYRPSRSRLRRGMGDVCTMGDADYDPNFCAGQSSPTIIPGAGQQIALPGPQGPFIDYTTGTAYSGPTYTAPSQSNAAAWAAFAAAAAKAGFTLAEINAIQPGTVVGANGQILRQNPGYAVPAGGTLSSSLSLMGGSSTALYLGVGLVALVVLGSVLSKR